MSNMLPLPGSSMVLSEGEIVVRKYHITNSKRPKSRGDVAITNKRIIYQGKGKSSTTVKEIPIETISAINTYCGSGFNFGKIILGIVFIAIGAMLFATIVAPIIGLILGILFIAASFESGYMLSIKSSAVTGTGISVGASDITVPTQNFFKNLFSTSGQGAALAVNAEPTAEALQMMNELGAIVLDLKIMGDRAIQKWQNYQANSTDTSGLNAKFADAVNLAGIKSAINRVQTGIQAGVSATQQQKNQQQGYAQGSVPQTIQSQPQPSRPVPPPPPAMASRPTIPPPPPPPSMASRPVPPPPPPSPTASSDDSGFFG